MASKVKNMTSGSPGRLIIMFAIPLMLGNIFQQFYTMVDTMVVGQFVGIQALAALGAADWLVWLVLGLVSGMTQGFSILVSQYYGGRGMEKNETVHCMELHTYRNYGDTCFGDQSGGGISGDGFSEYTVQCY